MNFSFPVLKQYRFKEENKTEGWLFLKDLQSSGFNFSTLKFRKGLPQYKGQVKTGWSVFCKGRTVVDEIAATERYTRVSLVFKQQEF
jgi:hypothetical protein